MSEEEKTTRIPDFRPQNRPHPLLSSSMIRRLETQDSTPAPSSEEEPHTDLVPVDATPENPMTRGSELSPDSETPGGIPIEENPDPLATEVTAEPEASTEIPVESTVEKDDEKEEEKPVKRKRGRPRKHPKPEDSAEKPKRKRGRPRKHPKPEDENKPKRKRGRPRKNPKPEVTAETPTPGMSDEELSRLRARELSGALESELGELEKMLPKILEEIQTDFIEQIGELKIVMAKKARRIIDEDEKTTAAFSEYMEKIAQRLSDYRTSSDYDLDDLIKLTKRLEKTRKRMGRI